MENLQSVLAVKFTSVHSSKKLGDICGEDLEIFKVVPGLIQKYYLIEETTGAISGIYIFKNKDAREAFWSSALAKTIIVRYGVDVSTLRVEFFDMAIVLNTL